MDETCQYCHRAVGGDSNLSPVYVPDAENPTDPRAGQVCCARCFAYRLVPTDSERFGAAPTPYVCTSCGTEALMPTGACPKCKKSTLSVAPPLHGGNRRSEAPPPRG